MVDKKHLWRNIVAASVLLSSGNAAADIPQVGAGIFMNMGGKTSWGIEAYGNYYPSLNDFPIPFFGGNIQIHFKRKEKATFVYSLQTGVDSVYAKAALEAGIATKGGKISPQYGIHAHALLPTFYYSPM